jgi:hypothetical protein
MISGNSGSGVSGCVCSVGTVSLARSLPKSLMEFRAGREREHRREGKKRDREIGVES